MAKAEVLPIKDTSESTVNAAVCSNQLPFLWNGNKYSLPGTYTKTFVNAVGCDSVAKLKLFIKDTSESTVNAAICSNQLPFFWNGNNYSLPGTYIKTFVNSVGCDSVAKLKLVIKDTSGSIINKVLCSAQLPYNWNGNNYSIAGTFIKVLVNAVGCDSTARLVLAIKDTSESTVNAAVCSNQLPFVWNGNNYSLAGTYTKTFVNSVGCDSVGEDETGHQRHLGKHH